MKLTKTQLRKLIKEELHGVLEEGGHASAVADARRLQREVVHRSPHRAAAMKRVKTPGAHGIPERPPRQEIDQIISNIIADIKKGSVSVETPGQVIELLQQISSFYTGG